jgi:hypothetical protein
MKTFSIPSPVTANAVVPEESTGMCSFIYFKNVKTVRLAFKECMWFSRVSSVPNKISL